MIKVHFTLPTLLDNISYSLKLRNIVTLNKPILASNIQNCSFPSASGI